MVARSQEIIEPIKALDRAMEQIKDNIRRNEARDISRLPVAAQQTVLAGKATTSRALEEYRARQDAFMDRYGGPESLGVEVNNTFYMQGDQATADEVMQKIDLSIGQSVSSRYGWTGRRAGN